MKVPVSSFQRKPRVVKKFSKRSTLGGFFAGPGFRVSCSFVSASWTGAVDSRASSFDDLASDRNESEGELGHLKTYSSVKRGAVHVQKGGHFRSALSRVDQLPGVADLLRSQFSLTPELDAPAFRSFHSGSGSFGNQAALKLGKYSDHLPHGAAGWRVSVYGLRE